MTAARTVSFYQRQAQQDVHFTTYKDEAWGAVDWDRHQSCRRYLPEPVKLAKVTLALFPVVLYSMLVTLAVGLYCEFAEPAGAPKITGHSAALMTPVTVTSFALSLLLVFKTNSSYSRWSAAVGCWGGVFSKARTFLRLATSFVGPSNPELMPALFSWACAFMPAMAAQLRSQQHYIYRHLSGILTEAELDWLASRANPANAVMQVLSRLLDRAQLTDLQRRQLEEVISGLDSISGQATQWTFFPLPVAYHRFCERFLLIFVSYLPFPFWDLLSWWSLPIVGMITFLLFGIENIGCYIEEPHRTLPLDLLIRGQEMHLRGMLADDKAAIAIADGTDPPSAAAKDAAVDVEAAAS